jgi:hypothetical protein
MFGRLTVSNQRTGGLKTLWERERRAEQPVRNRILRRAGTADESIQAPGILRENQEMKH